MQDVKGMKLLLHLVLFFLIIFLYKIFFLPSSTLETDFKTVLNTPVIIITWHGKTVPS